MTDAGAMGAAPPTGAPDRQVPALRLLATLGVAGMLAGLLLVVVFEGTQPAIQAHKARVLQEAISEVLHAPDRYDTLYVYEGRLVAQAPDGVDGAGLERVYLGYRGDEPLGFAAVGALPGFQDFIRVIFGYDPAGDVLLGMKVLESKETPGLGDGIEYDMDFVTQFDGAQPMLEGVKKGQAGDDPAKIDMITGATISSRAVIRIINETLEPLEPMLRAYESP